MNILANIPIWQPASVAVDFVAKISLEISSTDDRRSEHRIPVAVPVAIQPLGESLNPTGEAIHGITRDLSQAGVGIFHVESIESEFVEISATSRDGESVTAIGRVVHSNTIGQYYLSGFEFLFGVEEVE